MPTINSWARINELPTLAGAFVLLGGKWGTAGFGLPSNGPITWNFAASGSGQPILETPYRQAVAAAFDVWAMTANLQFQQVPDGSNANINLFWRAIDGSGNTLGQAIFQDALPAPFLSPFSGVSIEFDIGDFNPGLNAAAVNAGDFLGVAIHEIGHALGLGHPESSEQIMFSTLSAGKKTLSQGDVEGIQLLYGPAPGVDRAIDIGSDGGETMDHRGQGDDIRIFALGGNDIIFSGSGADRVYAGAGRDAIETGSGNDVVIDPFGNDRVSAGGGDDLVRDLAGQNTINGDGGNDTIAGGYANDILRGGNGSDALLGDAYATRNWFGDDTLDGGLGDDILTGGAGADTFIFRPTDGSDTIGNYILDDNGALVAMAGGDFEPGRDKVDVREFGFNSAAEVENALIAFGGSTFFQDGSASIFFEEISSDRISADDFIWA